MINTYDETNSDEMKISKRLNDELENRSKQVESVKKENDGIPDDYQLQILNNVDDHVYLTDLECDLLYANSSYCYFHQKQPDEIVGQNLQKIIGEEKFVSLTPLLNRCLEGETITYRENLNHPEGRDMIAVTSHYPYYDSHGLLSGVITISKITESNPGQTEAKKNPETKKWQDKYELITQNTSDVVWILNLSQQKFTFFSPSVYQMTGYTSDEAVNMGLHESLAPESANYLLNAIPARLHEFTENPGNKKSYYDELRQPCKNGELIWIESSTQFRFGKQGDIEIVGISRDITRRKLAEIALKESENKLSKLLEKLPGGIFQYRFYPSGDYKIEFMSKWAEALFEKPVNDLLNPEILYKNIHPEDLDPFLGSIKDAYTDLTPWFNESRLLINNQVKWIRGIAISEKQDDDSVLWNGVLLDVTREKTASRSLEKSKERYKSLNLSIREMLALDTLPEIYQYIIRTLANQHPSTAVIFASVNEDQIRAKIADTVGIPDNYISKTLALAGYDIFRSTFKIKQTQRDKFKSGELVKFSKGFTELVGPEIPSFLAKAIENFINIPSIYAIGINKDEKLLGIVYFFSKDRSFEADSIYVESFIRQAGIIIERKLMEIALLKNEKMLRNLVENQGEGVGVTDVEEKFNFANPAAERIFGVEPGGLIHRSLKEFLSHESYMQIREETKLRENGKKSTYEIEIIQPGGRTVPLLVTATPQTDETGKFVGTFGVFRDITERKEAENKLIESNNTKDKLFNIIAHDLKNPMNSIVGFSELINKNYESYSTEKLKKYNDYIYNSASSVSNLLDNLLLWSHSQRNKITLEPSNINVYNICQSCINLLNPTAQKKKIQIINHIPEGTMAHADKDLITIVVRNLISNAIKFTKTGGKITVNSKANNHFLVLQIKDTGVGMDKEIVSKLFELDDTYSEIGTDGEKGTGLGLIICKEFIEKNNGEIWVESEKNKGSTFYVSIPLGPTQSNEGI